MPACSALPGHVKPKQSCAAFSRRAVPSLRSSKLFDQTGVLSQSDNHVRRRRESWSAYCPAKLSISRSRSRKSPVKGLPCLTQTARNSANVPLVMHWRKGTVKFKVGEREFYYGLFIDLDEAERVCAAPRPRTRPQGEGARRLDRAPDRRGDRRALRLRQQQRPSVAG